VVYVNDGDRTMTSQYSMRVARLWLRASGSVFTATLLGGSVASAQLQPLQTAASLSARPAACAFEFERAGNVWTEARAVTHSEVINLCSQMARILGALRTDPKVAAEIGAQVKTIWTENAPTRGRETRTGAALEIAWRQVEGRLALSSGDAARAFQTFESTSKQVTLAEWDPETLRDYAVSAVLLRKYDVAANLYRRLVAVSSWLPARDRTAVRIEGAMALLRVAQPKPTSGGFSEALGYLEGLDAYQADSQLAELMLALVGIAEVMSGAGLGDDTRRESAFGDRPLRSMARLGDDDWRLIETWRDWSRDRDVGVWGWVNGADVPDSFKLLVRRLTAGA
jgi:hypothetical protein